MVTSDATVTGLLPYIVMSHMSQPTWRSICVRNKILFVGPTEHEITGTALVFLLLRLALPLLLLPTTENKNLRNMVMEKIKKQAGAELCQAQHSLS